MMLTPEAGITAKERDVRALVVAAMELLAERGPSKTSLRQVSQRAGVNYGLIHQYIGSKDDLVRLVTTTVSAQTAEHISEAESLDEALESIVKPAGGQTLYIRMLAHAILDGYDSAQLLDRSPARAALTELVISQAPDSLTETEASARVAGVMALVMGWQMFGTFLLSAMGLEGDPSDRTGQLILDQARDILMAPTSRVGHPGEAARPRTRRTGRL